MPAIRRPPYASRRRSRAAGAAELESLPERPLISVVMPAYETAPRYVREAIASVRRQRYPNWELCIVDDGSTRAASRRMISRYAGRDRRVKAKLLPRNTGIANATNEALALASGELVAFLDHDDALTEDALLRMARTFSEREIDVAYSDQDKITPNGRRADPFFKPDWSPVYALGAMYIGHLLVVRRELAEAVGGFDPAFDTIQDFEFALRVSEGAARIHHVPRILYHWRAIPGSIAAGALEKEGVPELQARAVTAHLRRRGISATAVPHPSIPHRARLRRDPRAPAPPVSVLVAVGDRDDGLDRCLDALLERTAYPNLEVVLVELGGGGPSARHPLVRVIDAGGHASPARAASLGAERASGEHLVFLGDATEVVEPDWIEQLLVYAELPGVGAVAPVLTRPDGRVDSAGMALGLRDPVVPAMRGFEASSDGYYGSLSCAREVSAISAECMLIRRRLFCELGGFEPAYRSQYEDFDLCQRLRRRGLAAVCVPGPRTISHRTEAARRTAFDVVDRALFVERWYDELTSGDPYFNPNFSAMAADYTVDEGDGLPRPIVAGAGVGLR